MSEVKRNENWILESICGKQVMTLALPDWGLLYVSHSGQQEMEKIRRAISRDEDLKIVMVTSERVYFTEK